MTSFNVNFKMRDRATEIKEVSMLELSKNGLGDCVIVHYVSSRDGLNHNMSYQLENAPKELLRALKAAKAGAK